MMKNKISARKCLIACVAICFIGFGVAFNAMAQLGNDPVGIFYDGIRNALGLTRRQLGVASNLANLALAVLLWFFGREYLNVGTLIYMIPYGTCANLGSFFYTKIFVSNALWCRISGSVAGCLLLYLGVALYIGVNIGVDPMTGIVLVIRDRMHWDFKRAKWLFDGVMILSGFLMGGTLGVVTLLTILFAGPTIQKMTEWVKPFCQGRDHICMQRKKDFRN